MNSLPKILKKIPKSNEILYQIWNFTKHIEKNIKFYYKNIPKIMKLLPIII